MKIIVSLLLGLSLFVSPLVNNVNATILNNEYKKETTVYITRTGSKYHRLGCQYLRKSQISIDKSSAIVNGYSACSRCNP